MAQQLTQADSQPAFITSTLLDDLPGVVHGFATAAHPAEHFASTNAQQSEDRKQQSVADAAALFAADYPGGLTDTLTVRQVHSPYMLVVHKEDRFIPRADSVHCDAIISDVPGLLVGVKTADCLPILIADPEHGVVAAVHAGWKGSWRGILYYTIKRMRSEFDSRPNELRIVFGPAARSCCYEVDRSLAAAFSERFGPEVITNGPKRPHLDLLAVNRLQAERLGARQRHMDALDACTICGDSPRFYSWRRDNQQTGRLLNAIGLLTPDFLKTH